LHSTGSRLGQVADCFEQAMNLGVPGSATSFFDHVNHNLSAFSVGLLYIELITVSMTSEDSLREEE
jgi:hypothetical protein